MESHQAHIVLAEGPADFERALTLHAATLISALTSDDDSIDPPLACVQLRIDGSRRDFTVQHVITDSTSIIGVVLVHSDIDESDESQTNLWFVLVQVNGRHFTAAQALYIVNQGSFMINRARMLTKLATSLFD